MGTRSAIGTANDDGGFEGRYCHWDGYPTSRGPDLLQTYAEPGSVAAVIQYAIKPGQEGYWSSFVPPSELNHPGRETWRDENGDSWVTESNDWGIEWAYLLSEDGIAVLEAGSYQRVALVSWDNTEADWEAIEKAGYQIAAEA